jgi:ATP-dependent Clp protease ATP-binding subunit ClpC
VGVTERFADSARAALMAAYEEAGSKPPVGIDHLLRALLRDPHVAELVAQLDGPPTGAHGITSALGDGSSETVGTPSEDEHEAPVDAHAFSRAALSAAETYAPLARRALDLSSREALSLGHSYVCPEHVLLGVIRVGTDGGASPDAARFVADHGIVLGAARWQASLAWERRLRVNRSRQDDRDPLV